MSSSLCALSVDSDRHFKHSVVWVDCLAGGSNLGRGLFIRGNHAEEQRGNTLEPSQVILAVPFAPRFSLVNHWTLKAFNSLYYKRQRQKDNTGIIHYRPFFYPLDAV